MQLIADGEVVDGVQTDASGTGGWGTGLVVQPGEHPVLDLVCRDGATDRTRLGPMLSDQVS